MPPRNTRQELHAGILPPRTRQRAPAAEDEPPANIAAANSHPAPLHAADCDGGTLHQVTPSAASVIDGGRWRVTQARLGSCLTEGEAQVRVGIRARSAYPVTHASFGRDVW
jgi:hypothetical protein